MREVWIGNQNGETTCRIKYIALSASDIGTLLDWFAQIKTQGGRLSEDNELADRLLELYLRP